MDGAQKLVPSIAPRTQALVVLALIALFVLVYVVPLPVRPLASPDEVRYGAIAREMLTSGDWVSPRFNGVRYFEKPILGHWLNALSLAAFGENAFALRLPAALETGLTAWLVFVLARRFVSAFAAPLSTGIYLTTFLVAGVGTFAVLDALFTLFLTAALAAWYLAMTDGARRMRYLVLCGCACGGAFLTKGFIGWAIPAIVAAPYLIARREWRELVTLPWVPIGVAAAVALPWAVLIQVREPDFWHYFFWVEHVQRFAGEDAQHALPFWYYAAVLPLLSWPWILLAPAALIGLRSLARPRDPFLTFASAWALLPFLLLSVSKGKVATYVLPCFAPLSILLAAGLERYLAARPVGRAVRIAALAVAVVFALVLAALVAVQGGRFGPTLFDSTETAKLLALVGVLLAGFAAGVTALRSRGPLQLAAVAVTGVAFVLPLQLALPQRVLDQVLPAVAIARYANAAPETVIVSDSSLFGTAAWVLERDDIYVVSPGEIEYGLSYPDQRHRKLDGTMLDELIAASSARAEILVICKPQTATDIAAHLPPTAVRTQHGTAVFVRIPRAA